MREVNPACFGHIRGVPLFTTWPSRKDCSESGVHPGIIAGIYGSKDHGAYSIALSGQYNDDDDLGETFMYTGTGGRAKVTQSGQKTKFGPQNHDQSFEHSHNKALLISSKTKKPVRVIRGFQCRSMYAPPEGYRYDGLYVVEEATLETGINGYKVCRFLFRRLPDQGNIPVLTYEQTLANMKKSKRAQARIIPAESESDGDSDSHSSSHPLPPSRSSSPSVSELAPIRTAPAQRVAGRGQGRGRSSQGGPLARIRKGIAGRRALDVNRLNHIRAIQGAQSSTQAE